MWRIIKTLASLKIDLVYYLVILLILFVLTMIFKVEITWVIAFASAALVGLRSSFVKKYIEHDNSLPDSLSKLLADRENNKGEIPQFENDEKKGLIEGNKENKALRLASVLKIITIIVIGLVILFVLYLELIFK